MRIYADINWSFETIECIFTRPYPNCWFCETTDEKSAYSAMDFRPLNGEFNTDLYAKLGDVYILETDPEFDEIQDEDYTEGYYTEIYEDGELISRTWNDIKRSN